MLPDLTVLVAVLLGLLSLVGGSVDGVQTLLGTAVCVLIGSALTRMALGRALRALEEGDLLVAEVSARWTTTWPFLAWGGCLLLFGWGTWVHETVPRLAWLGRYVVLFLPAAVLFGGGWVARARIDAGIVSRRGGIPLSGTPGATIRRGLRRNGMILLPLAAIIGLTEAAWVAGELGVEPLRRASLWREAMPLLDIGLMIGLVVLALPFIPLAFAKALRAQPLEDGRLRTSLERAAAALDLGYRDIMLWRTGGRVFNAMVVGFTRRTRLIFLTDGLLRVMPEDEILAVFCHEAGHAKRHHLPLFMVAFFSLSLLFYALAGPLAAIGLSPFMQLALHLVVIWYVLLGWVSRRFERESDVYGAEHAAVLEADVPALPVPGLPAPLPRGPVLMMRALERIKTIGGHAYSHRHGSLDDRVSFVAAHATDPDTRAEFGRTRRSILGAIALLAVAAVGATVLRLPTELAQAGAYVEAEDAMRAYRQAWDLAHGRDAREAAGASSRWRRAYERFQEAARRLEGFDDLPSRAYALQNRFNAADTAMHGLRDPETAGRDFRAVLALLDQEDLPVALTATLRFQTHVELGRLAAWRYDDLPVGHPQRDLADALDNLEKARQVRLAQIGASPDIPAEERAYYDERLRLLTATVEAARGERALARPALEALAGLGGPTPSWEKRELAELAQDARDELERLARADAAERDR